MKLIMLKGQWRAEQGIIDVAILLSMKKEHQIVLPFDAPFILYFLSLYLKTEMLSHQTDAYP